MEKKYWEKEKVTLKSEMGRLVEVMSCFLHTFNLSSQPNPDMAVKHITKMTPKIKGW